MKRKIKRNISGDRLRSASIYSDLYKRLKEGGLIVLGPHTRSGSVLVKMADGNIAWVFEDMLEPLCPFEA